MNFLIIQKAFPGDVILATSVVEKLHQFYPDSKIDFLLRKGNEGIFASHPFLNNLLIWDNKKNKLSEILRILKHIRAAKYDHIINLHRFASSGFVTAFSGAKNKAGFDKNPFSFLFSKSVKHFIPFPFSKEEWSSKTIHEVERNNQLIQEITDNKISKPKLYPTEKDFQKAAEYKSGKYICIAPASVWFTKQWTSHKWVELINLFPPDYKIYLLGAPSDFQLCEQIKSSIINPDSYRDQLSRACRQAGIINLSGRLSFLESAALMKDAVMNYVNDSAPMHLASAVNAPVTAVFCSTVPEFGFGPLSDKSFIAEIKEPLYCRPCGIHGKKSCPEKHFKCAENIKPDDVFSISLNQ